MHAIVFLFHKHQKRRYFCVVELEERASDNRYDFGYLENTTNIQTLVLNRKPFSNIDLACVGVFKLMQENGLQAATDSVDCFSTVKAKTKPFII